MLYLCPDTQIMLYLSPALGWAGGTLPARLNGARGAAAVPVCQVPIIAFLLPCTCARAHTVHTP